MAVKTPAWENTLLLLASEAQATSSVTLQQTNIDAALLKNAYARCRNLTAVHSRSFYLASSLLPGAKRRAVGALYAFCRISDDIVDQPVSDVRIALTDWRRRMLDANFAPNDWVALAWADTQTRYHIPVRYAEQLIEGVTADLYQTRYATFAELARYAYGVASTVGLMSMHIIGFSGAEAIPYAIKLGVALQVTNILRDIAEDWRAGRVYLPQEELAAFHLTEADLEAGQVDDRWRAFMDFQIARNRRLYREAWPGIALLHPEGRLAIAAAARFYEGILDDIERRDYDVFASRAHVDFWGKVKKLPGLWWETRWI
ncbi:squalene/phytoene synthase family protein [Chloroflexi bacterium TSY]|nr:squalene/phytoene synthase family protein [Chloroflexi bacterium TSY]